MSSRNKEYQEKIRSNISDLVGHIENLERELRQKEFALREVNSENERLRDRIKELKEMLHSLEAEQ